jgi:hypothetical protein
MGTKTSKNAGGTGEIVEDIKSGESHGVFSNVTYTTGSLMAAQCTIVEQKDDKTESKLFSFHSRPSFWQSLIAVAAEGPGPSIAEATAAADIAHILQNLSFRHEKRCALLGIAMPLTMSDSKDQDHGVSSVCNCTPFAIIEELEEFSGERLLVCTTS